MKAISCFRFMVYERDCIITTMLLLLHGYTMGKFFFFFNVCDQATRLRCLHTSTVIVSTIIVALLRSVITRHVSSGYMKSNTSAVAVSLLEARYER